MSTRKIRVYLGFFVFVASFVHNRQGLIQALNGALGVALFGIGFA